MKKIVTLVLTLGLLLSFAGCAKEAAPQGGVEGTPEEIIAKIYENHQPLQLRVDSLELMWRMQMPLPTAPAWNPGTSSALPAFPSP